MTNLSPQRIFEIEAEARALRAREFRRLVVGFAGWVRRAFGRNAQVRSA
ncbi:hypothetical protein SAMN05421774_101835 [Gemmobacter megaterium]|uniref:Uncharacterized protein n=1 Tax=Gemmobacter megaterium TaxID=1086013 RepID=A0A1N7L1A5_9RHOB|nr:hypothetical protein [Gemmobacter megaterium]GGE05063.1 hypothetical protein GCM10011345_08170 [Gemmobacter megaterium]SIS67642.1 hypothetical protein SAMN05421774_101835 [Gemmobacter megaterium]